MDRTVNSEPILHDVPPYMRVYTDGTIERLIGTHTTPASLDPTTGVTSRDVMILPQTGVSARLYHPDPAATPREKLPLVVHFHGGAFLIGSVAESMYHRSLNRLVKEAQVILVAIDYRRPPEHPLPAAYQDSWAALQWVASHMKSGTDAGSDPWLRECVDFDRVFLAGDSAGANISHHMAIKAAQVEGLGDLKILGILMIHPYFWGEEPIGTEGGSPVFKGMVDQWWRFVCPSDKGCDDPLINPFAAGAPCLEGLACDRVLVCVAGKDILRERGRLYFQVLVKGKWQGNAEFHETPGEDHVFHISNPTSENAQNLVKICAKFINQEPRKI